MVIGMGFRSSYGLFWRWWVTDQVIGCCDGGGSLIKLWRWAIDRLVVVGSMDHAVGCYGCGGLLIWFWYGWIEVEL